MAKKKIAPYKMTKKLKQIAVEAISLKNRSSWPQGHTKRGQKWYPAVKGDCCIGIRDPSHRWPYSLLTHCRTSYHIATVNGIDPKRLAWAIKRIETETET